MAATDGSTKRRQITRKMDAHDDLVKALGMQVHSRCTFASCFQLASDSCKGDVAVIICQCAVLVEIAQRGGAVAAAVTNEPYSVRRVRTPARTTRPASPPALALARRSPRVCVSLKNYSTHIKLHQHIS
ncbi:hypothetical protein RR48_05562 [Papilio machaon]|uniref:Uncharacterized protein n=1 Tax=Papilio machaon TaxID=76193 RepID=A0A0N1IB09_PAPMA|nr:hypothetical protein RR48_05562 [Papilio machaon]